MLASRFGSLPCAPKRGQSVPLLIALVTWLVAVLTASTALAAELPIRVGVLAYRSGDHANAAWEPTIRYLAEHFPDRGAEMVPLDLPGMEAAVQARTIDLVLTNTANYVELEARHGVTRIATLLISTWN